MEKEIPIKYSKVALIPDDVFWKEQKLPKSKYRCISGEVVQIKYIAGFDNSGGRYDCVLDRICNEIYGCTFSFVNSIWYGRIGPMSGVWHKVMMVKV